MPVSLDSGWIPYAVTGRPDFLNYLRRGDVSWNELWEYYRNSPADPAAMLRLSGLFHIFLSHEFDGDGCMLDPDGGVYGALREWARFAAESAEFLPEDHICASLAALVGDSLVSPLYFQAVFSTYVEAAVERAARSGERARDADEVRYEGSRRLQLVLPDGSLPAASRAGLRAAILPHLRTWEPVYCAAVGDEPEEWMDEGGSE